jgi:hypothetical protein
MLAHKQVSDPEIRPASELGGSQVTPERVAGSASTILREMRAHAPFTLFGTLTGITILVTMISAEASPAISTRLFWGLHPLHVLLSALVTTAMFTMHSRRTLWATIAIGYVGSVGIATLSDCVIPYIGESLLDFPNRGIHLGFIEKWWLVNPLAAAGILWGYLWPRTKIAHAGHVLLSTWASLFHMTMAMGGDFSLLHYAATALFLFLAVWIPCCTSDIVFPLLFAKK